jgi:hypothetical protein
LLSPVEISALAVTALVTVHTVPAVRAVSDGHDPLARLPALLLPARVVTLPAPLSRHRVSLLSVSYEL